MSGYVKLFSSLLDSTVWYTPPAVKVVWITMLAMADRDGIVEASVPGLASRAGVPREDCETALFTFISPDPDSRTKDFEGRRIEAIDGGWKLLNYEKYREKASKEEAAEKNRQRQERSRDRKRNTVTRNAPSREVTAVTVSNDIAAASPSADPPPSAEAAPASGFQSLPESDIETLTRKIRAHDVFAGLDARRLANTAAHRIQSAGKPKLAWVLTAIDDCAEKSDGLGLTSEALQAKLVGFMKAARAPRKDPEAPSTAPYHRTIREEPPSGIQPTAPTRLIELLKDHTKKAAS